MESPTKPSQTNKSPVKFTHDNGKDETPKLSTTFNCSRPSQDAKSQYRQP